MKKFFFVLVIIFCFCFSGCGIMNNGNTNEENYSNNETKNEIVYSTNWGTKIEEFSLIKQSQIGDYVIDCKALFVDTYKENIDGHVLEPFVDFTDVFVYDFSDVNEAALDKDSMKVWGKIKSLRNNEATPLMYIELNGYCPYFGDYGYITQINQIGIMNGFFIYNDNTVVQVSYIKGVANSCYIYELVRGTNIINCGNKYAESIEVDSLKGFDSTLKILRIVN